MYLRCPPHSGALSFFASSSGVLLWKSQVLSQTWVWYVCMHTTCLPHVAERVRRAQRAERAARGIRPSLVRPYRPSDGDAFVSCGQLRKQGLTSPFHRLEPRVRRAKRCLFSVTTLSAAFVRRDLHLAAVVQWHRSGLRVYVRRVLGLPRLLSCSARIFCFCARPSQHREPNNNAWWLGLGGF